MANGGLYIPPHRRGDTFRGPTNPNPNPNTSHNGSVIRSANMTFPSGPERIERINHTTAAPIFHHNSPGPTRCPCPYPCPYPHTRLRLRGPPPGLSRPQVPVRNGDGGLHPPALSACLLVDSTAERADDPQTRSSRYWARAGTFGAPGEIKLRDGTWVSLRSLGIG